MASIKELKTKEGSVRPTNRRDHPASRRALMSPLRLIERPYHESAESCRRVRD